MQSSGLEELFQKNSAICSMEEYYDRLHRRKAGAAQAAASTQAEELTTLDAEHLDKNAGVDDDDDDDGGNHEERSVLVEARVKENAIFDTPANKSTKRGFASVSSKPDSSCNKMARTQGIHNLAIPAAIYRSAQGPGPESAPCSVFGVLFLRGNGHFGGRTLQYVFLL